MKYALALMLLLSACGSPPVPSWTYVIAYSWCIPHQGLKSFTAEPLIPSAERRYAIGATCNDGTLVGGTRSAPATEAK